MTAQTPILTMSYFELTEISRVAPVVLMVELVEVIDIQILVPGLRQLLRWASPACSARLQNPDSTRRRVKSDGDGATDKVLLRLDGYKAGVHEGHCLEVLPLGQDRSFELAACPQSCDRVGDKAALLLPGLGSSTVAFVTFLLGGKI